MQIPINVEENGRVILGMLHVPPRRAAGAPVIVLNYGLNGDRVDNHRLSILLAQRAVAAGVSILRFDYGGCGISSSEFHDCSISTKTDDAIAMIDFVRGCFHDEPTRLVLLGYSDGIRVVHEVLRQRTDIAAIAFWNPIIRSMTKTFRRADEKRFALEPTTRKLVFPLFGVYMGMDYLKEVNADLDTADVLAHPLPKLFVFGTGDAHTLAFQQELKELGRLRTDFDLREIDGANHLFNRTSWSEQLVDATIEWVLHTSG